jgi:YggT family protein
MMDQALKFLLDTAFGLLTYAFLLRFAMQLLRAPFRNPIGQAVTAFTDWAAKPLRRVLPGWRGVDWSTLALAWLMQFAWLVSLRVFVAGGGIGGAVAATLALLALVELFKAAVWLLVIIVFAQAILSWTMPESPLGGLLNALSFRFLQPIRRIIPPLGGTLDVSPLILIVLLQLVLIVPVPWLEIMALRVFGP